MEIEIIGFEKKRTEYIPICPNCHKKTLCIPIGGIEEVWKGILPKIVRYTEYHCENCGCKWKVKD